MVRGRARCLPAHAPAIVWWVAAACAAAAFHGVATTCAAAESVPAASRGAASADSIVLDLRGRVMHRQRTPLQGAEVFLEGTRRAATSTDADGRYGFHVVLPGPRTLIRAPVSLWLDAREPGWQIDLAGGSARLRLELRAYDDSVGARHLRVRSNHKGITAALARALADSLSPDSLVVDFIGAPGKPLPPSDAGLTRSADVVLPRSFQVDAAAAIAAGVAEDDSSEVATSETTVSRIPPPASAKAAPDTCTCRVEGTIEVQWDRPLPSRVPVRVWLERDPAQRDSVELALGSPRAFVLEARGCAPQRIAYAPHSKLHFERRSPEPVIECRGHRLRQVRIVLQPVGVIP